MHRGVYFDAWFPRQHCYHPSLPPRRLRMVDDLVDYRATILVWSALGGGSLALPYLEQEAFGPIEPRARFYGFVNDSEFIAACHAQGIKVMGIVFEAQGWEFPDELTNSLGEPVTDLITECVARDVDQNPCHARWVECPDREHQCFYMDRNNPVWRGDPQGGHPDHNHPGGGGLPPHQA